MIGKQGNGSQSPLSWAGWFRLLPSRAAGTEPRQERQDWHMQPATVVLLMCGASLARGELHHEHQTEVQIFRPEHLVQFLHIQY